MSCGRTLGHGQSCVDGNLCEQCAEIERIQLEKARLAIQVLKAQEIVQALVSALNLNDQLMTELIRLSQAARQPMPRALMSAKLSFDERMKKLLGQADKPKTVLEK